MRGGWGSEPPSAYEDGQPVKDLVEQLMRRDPAHRFKFIQSRASAVEDDAIDA
jgi:topoisomerase-4 subunit B